MADTIDIEKLAREMNDEQVEKLIEVRKTNEEQELFRMLKEMNKEHTIEQIRAMSPSLKKQLKELYEARDAALRVGKNLKGK